MMNRLLAGPAVMLGAILLSCNPVARYIQDESVLLWEGDIRVFDSLNAYEAADAETVLVTGSSSVRLWDSIRADLSPYRVLQRGYGGAKLSDFNYYASRILPPGKFKAIVVFVANDISGGGNDRTPQEVLRLYKKLVRQVAERNPGTPLFWIETTPTPSRWGVISEIRQANGLIREYCERHPGLYFVDTYASFMNPQSFPDSTLFNRDMLHLNREGYRLWAGIIQESLHQAGIDPVP